MELCWSLFPLWTPLIGSMSSLNISMQSYPPWSSTLMCLLAKKSPHRQTHRLCDNDSCTELCVLILVYISRVSFSFLENNIFHFNQCVEKAIYVLAVTLQEVTTLQIKIVNRVSVIRDNNFYFFHHIGKSSFENCLFKIKEALICILYNLNTWGQLSQPISEILALYRIARK
jgi:hypothetical protein